MSDPKYTVTVYAAAPGTPIYKDGAPKLDGQGNPETSVPGHMYYVTSNGDERNSWGFAPVEHGSVNGPGGVSTSDAESYHNPLYARTMEISKAQYDKLNEFGKAPDKYGFDMQYRDARNNCVDFTWAGLNHAGLKRTEKSLWDGKDHEVDGKLNYLPARNDDSIKTIHDPVPGSPLNKEQRNAMPDMKWWLRILSENEVGQPNRPGASGAPACASNEDTFEQLVRASASGDDRAFSAAAQGYLQSAEGAAVLAAGREANRQQDAHLQEYAALQQSQSATPPMSMRI